MTDASRPGFPPSGSADLSPPIRLGPEALAPATWSALATGTVLAQAEVAALTVSGPGAVTCVQGLLTTDIAKPGEGAFLYGALLTPKGMILVDGWAARQGTSVTYTTPVDLAERVLAIFRRALPPRLARVSDVTSDVAVFRLAGPHALATAGAAGLGIPGAPGVEAMGAADDAAWRIARSSDRAPFTLQVTVPTRDVDRLTGRLTRAGALIAGPLALDASRILSGWPQVGAETDDRTLPQEVRFDEIGGVSYTKGCYTGQETVSRLHFRGHANRVLRGLRFDEEPQEGRSEVTRGERDVGRVTSLLWVPGPQERGAWLGLAIVRREVDPGAVVRAAGRDARVVDLPFEEPRPT
jgi:folate-binding protein YgfZ